MLAEASNSQPRYEKVPVPREVFLSHLLDWRSNSELSRMSAAPSDHITVDVCIPTVRVDTEHLERILSLRCSDPQVHIRFFLQVDREPANISPEAADWVCLPWR